MESREIRKRFLNFFASRGHAVLSSASLLTSEESSVTGATLFNTAGVQPIIPAILAGEHPEGSRLVSAQKCVRTTDLEEVGDNTHLTFFEMLGNWSIGDYFKTEAITWSWKLLTDKKEGLNLDPKRLYVTVFEGDENAPRDDESYRIWVKIFENAGLEPEKRIFFMPAENNWWAAGDNGPCGPDTEMFYDVSGKHVDGLTKEEYIAADEAQEVVEIWNDVFMEFEKKNGQIIGRLPKQNVDTGSGLERLVMVLQGKNNVFEIDAFAPVIAQINSALKKQEFAHVAALTPSKRIIADHIRTSIFLLAEGLRPGNQGRGDVLRQLLRRIARSLVSLNISDSLEINKVTGFFIDYYETIYPEIYAQKESLQSMVAGYIQEYVSGIKKEGDILKKQFESFVDGVAPGIRPLVAADMLFLLQTTRGIPLDKILEFVSSWNLELESDWEKKLQVLVEKHKADSRSGGESKFKGGLADHGDPKVVRLHTAHHLLLAALQQVLGADIKQRGSNITPERLRIDFSFDRKMTPEEKNEVESLVNKAIQGNYSVIRREMPLEEAKATGAEMEFGAKYPDTVSVYFVEDVDGGVFSKEFCGGPHVGNTGELGSFRIKKEEASSAGVRRIKAVLE